MVEGGCVVGKIEDVGCRIEVAESVIGGDEWGGLGVNRLGKGIVGKKEEMGEMGGME